MHSRLSILHTSTNSADSLSFCVLGGATFAPFHNFISLRDQQPVKVLTMKIDNFLFVALVGVATIFDQATAMEAATYDMEKLDELQDDKALDPNTKNKISVPDPAQILDCNHIEQMINHNEIKQFPQPIPVTLSEVTAVKFKPMLRVTNGCHPYHRRRTV